MLCFSSLCFFGQRTDRGKRNETENAPVSLSRNDRLGRNLGCTDSSCCSERPLKNASTAFWHVRKWCQRLSGPEVVGYSDKSLSTEPVRGDSGGGLSPVFRHFQRTHELKICFENDFHVLIFVALAMASGSYDPTEQELKHSKNKPGGDYLAPRLVESCRCTST